jgi:hypothetical protein
MSKMSALRITATASLILSLCAVAALADGAASGGRWSVTASAVPSVAKTPKVTVTTPASDGWAVSNSSLTFSGTATAPSGATLTDVQYRLVSTGSAWADAVNDSGDWTAWHVDATLSTGPNLFQVRAVAGTAISNVVTRNVVYTAAPPAPVITSPTDGSTVTTTQVLIKGTVAKNTGGIDANAVELFIDGSTTAVWAMGSRNWTYLFSGSPGSHTVVAYSVIRSAAPNDIVSAASNPVTFTYAPPPQVTVTTPPSDGWVVSSAAFTFSGTVSVSSGATLTDVMYRLNPTSATSAWTDATNDSGDWTAWHVDATLNAGANVFQVKAVAGTVSSPVVTRVIGYSTAPPVPVITAPTDGSTVTSPLALIKGTVAKNTGGIDANEVQLSIDGGTPVAAMGTRNWMYAFSATEGSHTVQARSVIHSAATSDIVSAWSSTVTFTYAPPPTAVIDDPSSSGQTVTAATLVFDGHCVPGNPPPTGVPAVQNVQYRLNAAASAGWTDLAVSGANNAWTTPALTLKKGLNVFYVRAVAGSGSTSIYGPVATVTVILKP